ncbi:MAG: hypothetical protein KH009_02305 [Clostridiales bacterium]|nr:hypothetical protein [Clostridiales bacterium]
MTNNKAALKSGIFGVCSGILLALVFLDFSARITTGTLSPDGLRTATLRLAVQTLLIVTASTAYISYTHSRTNLRQQAVIQSLAEANRLYRYGLRAAGGMIFCHRAGSNELLSPQPREDILSSDGAPLADSREKWLEDFPRESGEIYSSLLTVRGGDGYERQLEITALVPEDNADELIGCVLSADAVQRASSL